MLYGEFLEGTGCKQTEYNYQVYKRLEIIYMNDDTMTKQEVYDWGKKLVNNEKSEQEIERENKWKDEIKAKKQDIKDLKQTIEIYNNAMNQEQDWKIFRWYESQIKSMKNRIKELRAEIKNIEFVLG